MTVSWAHHGRPSVLGSAVGAIAGLATVTPAAGYVTVPASLLIGIAAGLVCYWAVQLRTKLTRIDDALDVWGVHGVGGTVGVLAAGLLATKTVNPDGPNGLLYGEPAQFLIQLFAAVVIWVYSAGVTWLILKLIDLTIGLRVQESEEVLGLDTSQHGEAAYQL
jgi:Amt family ammonium transporter